MTSQASTTFLAVALLTTLVSVTGLFRARADINDVCVSDSIATAQLSDHTSIEVRSLGVEVAESDNQKLQCIPTGELLTIVRDKREWNDGRDIWWASLGFSVGGHSPVLASADIDGDGQREVFLRYKTGANQTILEILRVEENQIIRGKSWVFSSNLASIEYDGGNCIRTANNVNTLTQQFIQSDIYCLSGGQFVKQSPQ